MHTNLSDLIIDLRNLAARCLDAPLDESCNIAREMRMYMKHLPRPDQLGVQAEFAEKVFEAKLELGCALEACFMMIMPKIGYMLSCGGSGLHVATIVLPANAGEHTCSANSDAIALTGALAIALSTALESIDRS